MQRTFVIFLSLIVAIIVFAAINVPWDYANTQQDMNIRAGDQYKQADDELKATYKKLTNKLGTEHKTKVKKAEVAWIEFRDLHCEAESHLSVGGSIHPLRQAICRTSLTKERIKHLEEMLENASM